MRIVPGLRFLKSTLAQVDLHRVRFWTNHHICRDGDAGPWHIVTHRGCGMIVPTVPGQHAMESKSSTGCVDFALWPYHQTLELGSTSGELPWKPLWRWPPEARPETPRRGWRWLEIDSTRKVMNTLAKQPFYPFDEVDDTLHSGMQHKTMCSFHILAYSTDLYVMIYWCIYIFFNCKIDIYIYIYM